VFTGAAGDTVTIAYSAIPVGPGPVPETTISWAGPTTITGGTGRFAGASGDAWIVGGYCFVADRGFFSLDGTIMLPKER
jgi:hypothetical protein